MAVLCCCRGEKYRSAEGRIETPHPRFPTRPRPLATGARSSPCLRSNGKATAGPVDATVPQGTRREVMLQDATLDPAILDVDDSDEDNHGERRVAKNSSTSTLGGLKARFVRRLSQHTEPGSQVQHAVHSGEELARRAELKRIRHMRIQEELQLDCEEEGRRETPCRPASAPGSSRELPRAGPRDTIEFGVGPVGGFHPAVPLGLPIAEESLSNLSRWRGSCSEPATRPPEPCSAAPRVHIRPMCSLTRLPSSSHPDSVLLPDDGASLSLESWRLSYSAGNIVISEEEDQSHGYRRISSQESSKEKTQSQVIADPDVEFSRDTMSRDADSGIQKESQHGEAKLDFRHTTTESAPIKDTAMWSHGEAADGDSPLDLWLRVQAKARAPDESQRQVNSDIHVRPPITDFSTVSHRGNERGGVIPLTKGSTRLNDTVLLRSPGPTSINKEHSQIYLQGSSGKLQNNEALSELDGHSPRPKLGLSLSQHATCPSNKEITPSLASSDIPGHFSPYGGIAQSQPKTRTVTLSHPGYLQISDARSYKTAPAKATTPESAGVHLSCFPQRPPPDTQSVAGFETASFKLREAELSSVARRFVAYDAPREPRTRIVSKFREEFDRDNAAKSNLLARFRVSKRSKLPRRRRLAKGPPAEKAPHRNCVADALDASHLAATHSRSRPASPRFNKAGRHGLEPNAADSATELWQRAVRLEVDRRKALRRDKEKYTSGHDGDHQDKGSEKAAIRNTSALPFLEESGGSNRQRPCHNPERYDDSPPCGDTIDGPGFYLYRKPRLPILPSVWARWSSHTRAERTGSAGKSNNVSLKDLATMGEPASGNRPAIQPRSLMSGALARALRNSFATTKPGSDVSSKSWERLAREHAEKHQKCAGDLEYPELDIPPAFDNIEEPQAPEQRINRSRHHPGSPDRLSGHNTGAARNKTPLGFRVAQEMHQLRHEDEDLAEPYDVLKSGNSKFLMSPKPSPAGSRQRHVSTATTERFLTPTSHLSYEDCMPNKVLNDHGESDSVRSDSDILVRQSRFGMEHRVPHPPKYLTWSGRAKTQPVLLESTREFGAELERMLAEERNKIMGPRSIDDG